MSGALLGAGAAALIGAPHCAGMCGGFAAASAPRPTDLAAWTAGRVLTYTALGALAGGAGAALPGPGWIAQAVSAVLLVWFAGRLAGLFPSLPLPAGRLTRLGGRLLRQPGLAARFGFGVVNGLLPCGLVYAALALPVASGSAARGALAMAVFGLGTAPGLALGAWGIGRLVSARPWGRKALALLVLLSGAWAIGARQPAASPDAPPPCHAPAPAAG